MTSERLTSNVRHDAETHRIMDGRRWRVSDPALDPEIRQLFVNALMDARRAVKAASKAENDLALASARRRVNDAKVALGERGPKWWEAMSEGEVGERLQCCRRTLESVGHLESTVEDLRRRLHLEGQTREA